jgi:hypothetical protein
MPMPGMVMSSGMQVTTSVAGQYETQQILEWQEDGRWKSVGQRRQHWFRHV